MVALIALGLSYISPSKLIFTIVSYVWAGIGCTFSVVILFTLFWKRYHGRAAIITIISGIFFTILWISGGFEQHYRVTGGKTEFLVNQNIIKESERVALLSLEGKRFVSSSGFDEEIRNKLGLSDPGVNKLAVVRSAFTVKGVPARLTTFIVSLLVAVVATLFFPPGKKQK